jgi:5'-3' exoribonuclease 1
MDSPMQKYYPLTFEFDMNGKKNDWEAVILIPYGYSY